MLHLLIVALVAQPAPARQPPAAKKPNACALLADADVRAVLGVSVKARQPASHEARGLLLSQCYLSTGTPRSVSIAVAGNTRSGGKTVTPRAFWRDQFHGRDEHASERVGEIPEARPKGERPEADGDTEARPIGGIGDEAFWSGTRVAGALYVLRGNTFIRVSVGGISDEQERIEKSRQLAVTALARLQ
jgi:hypothetical protein